MTATERSYAATASTDDLPTPLTAAEFSVLYYLATMGNSKVHSLERTRRCAGLRALLQCCSGGPNLIGWMA